MLPNYRIIVPVFLVFSLLLIPQCLADVVPVSVFQQVSGSGNASACDGGCQMMYGIQHVGSSFSFQNANTTLPAANLNENGSATDFLNLGYSRTAEADASSSQSPIITTASLGLNLFTSGNLSSSITLMTGNAEASSQYVLVFNLTSPSMVNLTGGIDAYSSFGHMGIDGNFTGEVHLTGPGVQFDQNFVFPMNTGGFQTFEQVLELEPGQYTLAAAAGFYAQQSYILDSAASLELGSTLSSVPQSQNLHRSSRFWAYS